MNDERAISFPVGYHDFHDDPTVNFQLNRWLSSGYSKYEDMEEAAAKIKSLKDWKREMVAIADKALSEGRPLNAAFGYRAAEFFTMHKDPDKLPLYEKFIELFYDVFKDDGTEKFQIPYEDSFLPAVRMPPEKSKGVILIHGGFDSIMEEFFSTAFLAVDSGYEVILFEGPGQGAALRKNDIKMTHEWEKPTSAVIDYLKLENVTLIGISLGGYLAIRAAAFEPRIKRIIAFDIIYDCGQIAFMKGNVIGRTILKTLFNFEAAKIINKIFEKKMRKEFMFEWGIDHGMYVTGTDSPYGYMKGIFNYSAAKISHLVKQDVLLLAGEEDHLIPLQMYHKQKDALKNAKSVTGRIFTKEEHASNHCQVGNVKLALDVMMDWIEAKS